jgi:hypothetical protein
MDQLQDRASGLTGAREFAVQVLQGFGNRWHPGFEVDGFDGFASAAYFTAGVAEC